MRPVSVPDLRLRARSLLESAIRPPVAPPNPCDTLNNCPGHQEGSGKYCACRAVLPKFAGVAQLVEHLICNQRVGGSNPFASSRKTVFRKQTEGWRGCTREWRNSFNALHQAYFRRRRCRAVRVERDSCISFPKPAVLRDEGVFAVDVGGFQFFAQVGEWLKPTDCKSVPPSEVRRFESFPVHQKFELRSRSAAISR